MGNIYRLFPLHYSLELRLSQVLEDQLYLPPGEVAVVDTVARSEQRGQEAVGVVDVAVAGTGCFFIENIYALLVMRALLGVSVGLIMPLSTGLLSYYYPPEEQARLMGLSAAMNQMDGV